MSSHFTPSHIDPTDFPTYLIINERDDAKRVAKWIKSGEFTPELFEKHLHHTAKDISQGRKCYKLVSVSLQKAFVWDAQRDDCVRLRTFSTAIADAILPSGRLLHRYITSVTVSTMLYANWHRSEEAEPVIDTQMSLIDAIKSIRSHHLSDEVAKVMDECCFKGLPRGTFLRVSPCATLNETQFTELVFSKLGQLDAAELWQECENVRRIGSVLDELASTYHPYLRECWNCKKVVATVDRCGKCKSALYCGRECQVTAWKDGHKHKCGRLKFLQERCDEDVKEFERAHLTGKIDGFELSQKADLWVLFHCNRQNFKLPKDAVPADMAATGTKVEHDGPSMKFFYENLGRIIRGEWWPCDLSEQDRDADDGETISAIRMAEILEFLSVDWFGMAKARFDSDDPNDVTSMTDPLFREICDGPTSAAKLLEVYHSHCGHRCANYKWRAYRFMREVYDDALE